MKTVVKLALHENYVNVIIRFHKQTFLSHIEYAFCGANAVELLKEPCALSELKAKVETFVEDERNVKVSYLDGFKGYFEFTYVLTNNENVTEFEVDSSRLVNESRGGRSVSGGLNDKTFGKRIFMNLLTAASTRDVVKLNKLMSALYTIGG